MPASQFLMHLVGLRVRHPNTPTDIRNALVAGMICTTVGAVIGLGTGLLREHIAPSVG